jgi:hypothetical protein
VEEQKITKTVIYLLRVIVSKKRRVSLINFESRSIFRLFENVSILENEIVKIQDKFKKKKSNVNELLPKT